MTKSSSKIERKGLQGVSETSSDVWFGHGGTDQKTRGSAGGGRDIKMLRLSLGLQGWTG